MINKKVLKLRKAHERAKSAHRGGRFLYPDSIKRLAVEILNSGVPVSALARQTGLNAPAILKWSRKINLSDVELVKSSRFRKLPLVTAPLAETFCILLPSGIRIECSAYHQLGHILREVA